MESYYREGQCRWCSQQNHLRSKTVMDMCTVNAPDHTWEAVLGEEGLFDYSFPVLIRTNNEHILTAY